MIRLLAVLVLAGASVNAQTTNYSDIVGTLPFSFYKNQTSQENLITSALFPNSFQARYGYWDFDQKTFFAYPSGYDFISVAFVESVAFVTLNVHPYSPELMNYPELQGYRPYAPPGPGQGLGIQFRYTESIWPTPLEYSSIIVLNSDDGDDGSMNGYLTSNDEAVVGQIQEHAGGTAITMVPEPSSLSLLLAGGAVALARRRKL